MMSVSNDEIFPFINFKGENSRAIGHEHGVLLADRIDRAIQIYQNRFADRPNYNQKQIENICEDYRRGIQRFSSDYIDELDAIAIASKQDPLWIVALNCRLEILNHLAFGIQNECTVLYDRSTCQLAENWDWLESFERLAFINEISSKGILQMTEPGVLGKVGLNRFGIGVTINFVDPPFQSQNHSYIPLHISLRAVLDQAKNFQEAIDTLKKNGPGFGGHVLLGSCSNVFQQAFSVYCLSCISANDQGQCCCVEFPGDQVRFIHDHPYHTNHFLSIDNYEYIDDHSRLQNSFSRYERLKVLWQERQTVETILSDGKDDSQLYPICRSYQQTLLGPVGTVCSMVMDLKTRTMKITKGNPRQNPQFHVFQIPNS